MSLLSRLLDAVHSWRRRRGGPKTAFRPGATMEHLEHRQVLSVTFTGNVATDFPASTTPGVVVLPNGPGVKLATIAPELSNTVKVSGFDITGLRVSYSASDDTLNIGVEQPASGNVGQPGSVIAGDADNYGNDNVVNPQVIGIEGPSFKKSTVFGGSAYMGAMLDLTGSGTPDVVAGYAASDTRSPKEFTVAQAVPTSSGTPQFGNILVGYAGNVYKADSTLHPSLEMSIAHFSELYQAETGKALTANSVINIGAFAGSGSTPGIGTALYPEQSVNIGAATVPAPSAPTVSTQTATVASPTVVVNYLADRHVNTARDTLVRVNVLGSSGFDVTKIESGSVTLGGQHPVFSFDRYLNKDNLPDATFVFRSVNLQLPTGLSNATVTGKLTDGTSFSSSVETFNHSASYNLPSQNLGVQQRVASREVKQNGFVVLPTGSSVATGSLPNASSVKALTRRNGFTVLPTGTTTTAASVARSGSAASQVRQNGFVVVSGNSRNTPTAATPVSASSTAVSNTASPVAVAVPVPSAAKVSTPIKVSTAVPTVSVKTTTKATSAAPVVSIKRREPVVVPVGTKSSTSTNQGAKISTKLQTSLNRYVRNAGAVNVSSGTSVGNGAL